MSARLQKTWRNSACMMMVAGPYRYRQPAVVNTSMVEGTQPPSSSSSFQLPLCLEEINDLRKRGREAMELLFVKRTSRAGFMPNTHVFPGGLLDKADYSPEWLDIFRRTSSGDSSKSPFLSLLSVQQASKKEKRLPIYSEVPRDGPIAGEIAFRICAIRETFEEAGVLLVRDVADVEGKRDLFPGSFAPALKSLPEGERQDWRKRVHDNADEFITMCKELQCVPDIWSLIEWSNWLTPHNLGRRYDTVFYLCFPDNKPLPTPDNQETTSCLWVSPKRAMQFFESQQVQLAPPQFAEMAALLLFSSAPCLHSYALLASVHGERERRSPVRMTTKDNYILSVMNNDDLYPAQASYWFSPGDDHSQPIQHHPQSAALRHVNLQTSDIMAYEYECLDFSAAELREMSQTLNRMEFRGTNDYQFVDNTFTREIAEYVSRYDTQSEACEEVNRKSKL